LFAFKRIKELPRFYSKVTLRRRVIDSVSLRFDHRAASWPLQ